MGGRPTWSGQRPLEDRFELDILERPGFPPNPPVDHVDFDDDAVFVAGSAFRRGPPRRPLLRRRDRAPGRRGRAGAGAVADRDRATGDAGRPRQRRGGRLHPRRGRVVADRPEGRSGGVPAGLPRVRRLRLRPALSPTAAAGAGRTNADRGARPLGGGDPARRARRGPVPDARRLGRPPRRLRRRLRRARGPPRGGSRWCCPASVTPRNGTRSSTTGWRSSWSGPRPGGADAGHADRRSRRSRSSSLRRMRGFPSFTISSR